MKNLLKKAVIFAVAGIMALSVEAQEEKGVQFTVSGRGGGLRCFVSSRLS